MDREMLKGNAKEQLRGKWGLAVQTLFVLTVLQSITSFFNLLEKINLVKFDFDISNYILVIVLILEGAFSVGACKFALNIITNKEDAKFNDGLSGFDIYFKTLGLNLLINLCTIVGLLLFVVPSIIIFAMFSQSFYILNEDRSKGIIDCLKESTRMMKGHKGEYLILVLSFIGWDILTIITLYVGQLWLNPYKQVTYANYYLELKKDFVRS